jgi:hypothetical protein
MSVPSLPADVYQELAINDASMDDIFADRPVSQGKRDPGVDSGRAIHLLQEQDDRQHTPGVALYESTWERAYEKTLELYSKHATDDKQVMVVGEDMEWNLEIINRDLDEHGNPTGEDLLGGSNRVRIKAGSSLPTNETLRRTMILEELNAGVYGNPADPNVGRKVGKQLDSGIVDDVYDDAKLDETKAIEENQFMMMMQGGSIPDGPVDVDILLTLQIPPDTFDNHLIHLMTHNRARKSADYRKLDETHRLVLDTHCDMHEELLMMQMAPPPEEGGDAPTKETATV